MSKKEVYEKKLQNQLDEWGSKIDELEIKAKKTEAEVQQKYEEEIDHLRSKQTEAYEKLSELKQSGDDAGQVQLALSERQRLRQSLPAFRPIEAVLSPYRHGRLAINEDQEQ